MVEDRPTAAVFDVYESFQCHLAKEEVSLVNLLELHKLMFAPLTTRSQLH